MSGFSAIALSFGLIALCAWVSRLRGEKLEKDFLIGGVRTIIQLLLLGYFLNWIFSKSTPGILLATAMIMTLNASLQIRSRIQIHHSGILLDSLFAMAFAIWPLAFLGSSLMQANPLWQVDVFLPLLGMLLGNTLSGISLGVNFFSQELKSREEEIFSVLALGASEKESTKPLRDRALKIAMTPMMNSMATQGIVSIPGMMTGQLLGGASPESAAVSQIIIMMLITAGTYAGTSLALARTRRKKFQEGVPCFA